MAKVIAMANQKGGVGKTTSCVNLSASLVLANRRVLMIDCDPQGNATMASGVDKHQVPYTLGDFVLEKASFEESVQKETTGGYHLLPANESLTAAEVQLLSSAKRDRSLFFLLQPILDDYDFILLDCPPSLNMLTVNGLVAADSIIIPMQCEYYALEGLSALVSTINSIRRGANPRLQVEGVLRTMYDGRNRLTLDVTEQLRQHFGDKVYKTVIPRNVRLAEAPSHGLPIIRYDKSSRGATAYMALAGELLKKNPQTVEATF